MKKIIIKNQTALEIVHLSPKKLKNALKMFGGEQQPRVIKGIYDNPGILTHEVCGNFYCNNMADIAQKCSDRLKSIGLELICIKSNRIDATNKSHHWYLCKRSENTIVSIVAANDPIY